MKSELPAAHLRPIAALRRAGSFFQDATATIRFRGSGCPVRGARAGRAVAGPQTRNQWRISEVAGRLRGPDGNNDTYYEVAQFRQRAGRSRRRVGTVPRRLAAIDDQRRLRPVLPRPGVRLRTAACLRQVRDPYLDDGYGGLFAQKPLPRPLSLPRSSRLPGSAAAVRILNQLAADCRDRAVGRQIKSPDPNRTGHRDRHSGHRDHRGHRE